jgi:hypothetical protein
VQDFRPRLFHSFVPVHQARDIVPPESIHSLPSQCPWYYGNKLALVMIVHTPHEMIEVGLDFAAQVMPPNLDLIKEPKLKMKIAACNRGPVIVPLDA